MGDWIAGIAPKRLGPGRLLFAMCITGIVPMREYDARFPEKRPKRDRKDWRRWLGDSIYDFSTDPPSVRASVHGEEERAHDLGGANVLLSDRFVYFGGEPIELPKPLLPIARVQQGHRSKLNAPFVKAFVRWFDALDVRKNVPLALPADDPFVGDGPPRRIPS